MSIEQQAVVNNPILVEKDFELAEKFADKLNIICVPNANVDAGSSISDLCRADNLTNKMAYFFYNVLRFQSFSQVVFLDLENITENLREAFRVQNLCSRLVPFLQCYLHYRKEFRAIYSELVKCQIHEKLAKMKFYSVKELQNIYRCHHDPSVSVITSNKTCLDTSSQTWKYFVRADILENDKEIIKGFVKLFISSLGSQQKKANELSERDEKDLTNFCLLIYQYSHFKIKDEDLRDIEKDHGVKLHLPSEEIKWNIPEHIIVKPATLPVRLSFFFFWG